LFTPVVPDLILQKENVAEETIFSHEVFKESAYGK